jgi:Domain of unknown function (DUF3846)
MATQIPAIGTLLHVLPANGTAFTLEELQTIVGGYIEAFYLRDGTVMMLNEDGKRLGLPLNLVATQRAHRNGLPADDCIVGDVVIGTWIEMGGGDED